MRACLLIFFVQQEIPPIFYETGKIDETDLIFNEL